MLGRRRCIAAEGDPADQKRKHAYCRKIEPKQTAPGPVGQNRHPELCQASDAVGLATLSLCHEKLLSSPDRSVVEIPDGKREASRDRLVLQANAQDRKSS